MIANLRQLRKTKTLQGCALWVACGLFLAHCSSSDDSASSGGRAQTGGDTDTSRSAIADAAQLENSDLAGLSVPKLKELYKTTLDQNSSEEEELTLLNGLNTILIQRKNKLLQECVIASKVKPDGTEKFTQSSATDTSSQQTIVRKVSVQLTEKPGATSPAGGYVLMVNELYQSSPFSGGAKTTLTGFTSIGSGLGKSPEWKSIYKLYLQPADPNQSLPPMDKLSLTIDIDGTVVASKPLLASLDHSDVANSSFKSYRVNLGEMMAMSLGGDCRVSDEELNRIKDTTRRQIQDSLTQKKTLAYAQGQNKSSIPSDKLALISGIEKLRENISARVPILEPARQQQFTLTGELQASLGIGCHANEPIRSLTIKVDGSEIPSRLKDPSVRNQKISTGACTSVEIRLGPDIAFTIDNDKTAIIGSSFTATDKDLSSQYKVGSIQYLSITKKGNCFSNQKSCQNVFFDQDCVFDIYEQHIYSVSGVSLTVNGTEVYNLPGLSLMFDSTHAPWTDRGLWSNPSWIQYMQRQDCNQTN